MARSHADKVCDALHEWPGSDSPAEDVQSFAIQIGIIHLEISSCF
jgi:hypothetical protein